MRHIVIWWALLQALGLVGLPLTFRLFSPDHAHGYPFSKIFVLLLTSYFSWLLGFHNLVPLRLALPAVLAGLAALAAWRTWADRTELARWLRSGGWQTMLQHDLLWTGGFLFFAWQRALAPDIFGAEKYMDFAFLNSLVRGDFFPPQDPWMAGTSLNYYYFGYLSYANLVRLSGVPGHVAYNLCIATVAGLGFSEFSALGLRLTNRLFFGVASGAAAMLLGNLDGFLQVIEKRSLVPIDYWRSSRVVGRGDTINEFPFFSSIHGDLHPHFQVLPVTGLFLAILLDRALFPRRDDLSLDRFGRLVPLVLVSFALGSMVAFSPWELPVGTLLVALLIGRHLPVWPLVTKARLQLAGQVMGVLVAACVLFLPFYVNFAPPTHGGFGIKVAHTAFGQFLTVFGHLLFALVVLGILAGWDALRGRREVRDLIAAAVVLLVVTAALLGNAVIPFVLVLGAALLLLYARNEEDTYRAPLALALVALIALCACEVVFLRDSYGEKLYRMNTVFKLYFQGWLLLSLAAPWAVAVLLSRHWKWVRGKQVVAAVTAALVLAACAYPVGLTATRWRSPWPSTLDGTAYLARDHADDFAAIAWLRRSVHGMPVILEASGDPYSYYARFSSNTGIPTVLGWANHEGLWRADRGRVENIRREVQQMYDAASLDAVRPLLERYGVEYIAVGELERRDYQAAGLEKFTALPVAFRQGNTVIYRWAP